MEEVHWRTHIEALFMLLAILSLATLSLSRKKASRETEPEESSEATNGDSEATLTHSRQKTSVTGKQSLSKSESN
jgi:hypothetical protein